MKRILQTTILVLAVSALVTPNALAQRPDDRAGMLGVGATAVTSGSARPDDRAGARGPGALVVSQSGVRPDDLAGIRGPGSIPAVFVASGSSRDGFDWSDAGVGAAGALGLALLLLGGLQLAARGRRDHAAA